jgi:hypothetical protein
VARALASNSILAAPVDYWVAPVDATPAAVGSVLCTEGESKEEVIKSFYI